jgi:hypothetical protein
LKDFVTAVNPSDISNIKDTFHFARFEVLMVENIEITAFWGVTWCNQVIQRNTLHSFEI